MAILDLPSLLSDLTPETPCGENLEYEPDFVELETLLQGKAEAQFGKTVIAAEAPDWKAAKSLALGLIARTRDLRLTVMLSRTMLQLDGIEGFADCVELLRGLVDHQWAHVHPQLDPSDGNDPVMRVNAIAALCDASITLGPLKDAWLAVAPMHGRFSLRHLDFLAGEGALLPGQEPPQAAAVNAAFMDMELTRLIAVVDATRRAHDSALAIEKALMQLVGAAQALDMSPLVRQLDRMHQLTASRLSARPDAPVEEPDSAEEADGGAQGDGSGGKAAARAARPLDHVESRDDVQRLLRLILDYYRTYEPSSPVPLLLERAMRLVPLGFLDIIRELAPEQIGELQKIRGNVAE